MGVRVVTMGTAVAIVTVVLTAGGGELEMGS